MLSIHCRKHRLKEIAIWFNIPFHHIFILHQPLLEIFACRNLLKVFLVISGSPLFLVIFLENCSIGNRRGQAELPDTIHGRGCYGHD